MVEAGNHVFHAVPNSISDTESSILSYHRKHNVTKS